jgi:hypothetical protein
LGDIGRYLDSFDTTLDLGERWGQVFRRAAITAVELPLGSKTRARVVKMGTPDFYEELRGKDLLASSGSARAAHAAVGSVALIARHYESPLQVVLVLTGCCTPGVLALLRFMRDFKPTRQQGHSKAVAMAATSRSLVARPR